MNKTKIEYLTHTWSFCTGCRHTTKECPCADECWARGMAHRFGKSFEPTLHPEKLLEPLKGKQEGRRIGVCFTGDLFGEWVNPMLDVGGEIPNPIPIGTTLKQVIYDVVDNCPDDQFFFLTKNPKGYLLWNQFPDNAYLGFTVCNKKMLNDGINVMKQVNAKHKWISFEPIMESMICQK